MAKEKKKITIRGKIRKEFNVILTVVNAVLAFVLLCDLTMIVRLHKEGASYSAAPQRSDRFPEPYKALPPAPPAPGPNCRNAPAVHGQWDLYPI